jgi:hypothetical protein
MDHPADSQSPAARRHPYLRPVSELCDPGFLLNGRLTSQREGLCGLSCSKGQM